MFTYPDPVKKPEAQDSKSATMTTTTTTTTTTVVTTMVTGSAPSSPFTPRNPALSTKATTSQTPGPRVFRDLYLGAPHPEDLTPPLGRCKVFYCITSGQECGIFYTW